MFTNLKRCPSKWLQLGSTFVVALMLATVLLFLPLTVGMKVQVPGSSVLTLPFGARLAYAITPTNVVISGTTSGEVNTSYTFGAEVSPPDATTPITYVWEATNQTNINHTGGITMDMASFTWATAGTQWLTVTAITTDGIVTSTAHGIVITQPVIVVPLNNATVSGPTNGLVNQLYSFSVITSPISATTPVNYAWSPAPNSGQSTPNVSYQWASPGVYPITVTVSNISSTVTGYYTITITTMNVVTLTNVAINGPTTGLANTTYTFSTTVTPISATTPITYTWTPAPSSGQGTAIATYLWATTGTQIISVMAQNIGAVVSNSTSISLTEAAIVGLAASNNGPTSRGSATTFNATVTSGSNVTYQWNFGNGATGSGATVNHTYATIGTYTAIVTASNSVNTASQTTVVTVLEVPISGLTASNNSPTGLGTATTLNASVTAGDNVSYSWNFGDSTTGSGASVNHTYPHTGTYNVTVTASNSRGSASATTVVTIQDAAIVGLRATNNSPTIIGNATTLNGTITSGSNVIYNWSFGDGFTATGAVVNHTYSNTGTYTAIVTANNTVGSASATTNIVINPPPLTDTAIVGLTATNDSPKAVNTPVSLSALVSSGSGISYTWNFGDGSTGLGAVVNHTYIKSGIYTATVTATNSISAATANVGVTILDTPIMGLTASNNSPTALADVTTLNASITAGDGVTYTWDFGDGSMGNGAVVSHTYAALGSYTAIVTASNSSGIKTANTVVTLISPVSLSISKSAPTSVKLGEPITYTLMVMNSGPKPANEVIISDPLPNGASYVSGGNLNGNVVSWTIATLPAKGTITVTFSVMATDTVTNQNYGVTASGGYSATGQAVVTTIKPPDAPISGLMITSNSPVVFGTSAIFNASVSSGDNVTYNWDFGDGTIGSGTTVSHTYTITETYTVTVKAVNNTNTVTKTTVVRFINPPQPSEGIIAGTVTAASGQALSGIYVQLYQNSWWGWSGSTSTQTDATGQYQFNVSPGSYRVAFFDWSQGQYLEKYYQNGTNINQATNIMVTSGAVANASTQLDKPGRITGIVRDPNGNPLSGISIEVRRAPNNITGTSVANWELVSWLQTNGAGEYEVSRLSSGTYLIGFRDWNNRYPPKYYQNATEPNKATLINVTTGATVSGIDISMDPPGRIVGIATDTAGNPISGIYVRIEKYNGQWWEWMGQAQTDGAGRYEIGGLNGTYRVSFSDANYWSRRYADKYFSDVSALPGQTTDLNVSLAGPGRIIGTATYANGNPVPNFLVKVFQASSNGNSWQEVGWGTWTDSNGQYSLDNLAEGTYRVGFSAGWGFDIYAYYKCSLPQGKSTRMVTVCGYKGTTTLNDATDVSVNADETTTEINLELPDPAPPLAEVKLDHGSDIFVNPTTGEVTVSAHGSNITMRKVVTCTDGSTPSNVALIIKEVGSYPMTLDPPPANRYSVFIQNRDLPVDNHFVEMDISKTCSGQTEIKKVGIIRWDPAGLISNIVTGEPIPGATVMLYNVPGWHPKQSQGDNTEKTCQSHLSKDVNTPWNQPAPTEQGVIALTASEMFTPAVNPLITSGVGRYAWDVTEGCWYVTVKADGYQDITSPVVGVPPAVTDLDVAMTPKPVVRFNRLSYKVNKEESSATITVSLNVPVTQTVTVDYATADDSAIAGQDYLTATGTLIFNVGQTSQVFTVAILNNAISNTAKVVGLVLSNATNIELGLQREAFLTILDNTVPTVESVQFSATDYQVKEDAGTATITVTLSAAMTQTVTVDYATLTGTATIDSDYTPLTGTLTFMPGEITKTFSVVILNDQLTEVDETISLALSNPSNVKLGLPSVAVLTIINVDPPLTKPGKIYLPIIMKTIPIAAPTNTATPMPTSTPAPGLGNCLSAKEMELAKLLNDYRRANGLANAPLSKSLTQVAQAHALDLYTNHPDSGTDSRGLACNLHSWSNKGSWTAVCYTADHQYADKMWSKPAEISNGIYTSSGYEISAKNSNQTTAAEFLNMWKSSSAHKAVILEQGSWANRKWPAMGVGIYEGYALVWFGDITDPQGSVAVCQ